MKKKPGFELKNVCGQDFLIAVGMENIDFSSIINLNETSSYLWKSVAEGEEFTAETLAANLEKEYEVDHETALRDSQALIDELLKAGVLDA